MDRKQQRQKTEGIDNTNQTKLSGQFLCADNYFVRQKGIYHQVEFCRTLYSNRVLSEINSAF